MSSTDFDPDIDGDIVGGVIDAGEAAAAGAIGAAACLACGAKVAGSYCQTCGQRHDAMRRNVFVLFWDYLRETFDFDSRMWRTAISLFAKPGIAAREYSHGARSRYTPPIRMFLVVSFLFFLTLSLTHTYFAAFDVRYDSAKREGVSFAKVRVTGSDQAEAQSAAAQAADESLTPQTAEPDARGLYVGDGDKPAARTKIDQSKCPTGVELKFFVKASDIKRARADVGGCVTFEREADVTSDEAKVLGFIEKGVRGAAAMAADPESFNKAINEWIPRVMFLMTPVLALIIAIFFRGKKDALLFDNVLQSLHLHAALFILTGVGVVAAQFGAPNVGLVVGLAIIVYFVAALKNAYGRGWVKTIYSAMMISFLYMIVLNCAVFFIVSRVLLDAG